MCSFSRPAGGQLRVDRRHFILCFEERLGWQDVGLPSILVWRGVVVLEVVLEDVVMEDAGEHVSCLKETDLNSYSYSRVIVISTPTLPPSLGMCYWYIRMPALHTEHRLPDAFIDMLFCGMCIFKP
ncbi:hypothetical protein ILYODFUR_034080 [Ilyodon furcidens]|uniref:Uncharacterized protein n=1 Tax=Ilyodon furcidens TaxID=33524 RepID=A0ABV0U0P5_9TELE